MRLLILLAVLFVAGHSSFAQLSNEAKLIDFLGQEKFDQLQNVNPNYLNYLDVRASEGYAVMTMDSEKASSFAVLGQIKLFNSSDKHTEVFISPEELVQLDDAGNLNILKCDLKFDQSQMTYYVLGTTGKVLLLYPVEYISKKLNSK